MISPVCPPPTTTVSVFDGRFIPSPFRLWWARVDRSNLRALRVPDIPAAVQGGSVRLAPDDVVDAGGADGQPEVVAIGEVVAVGVLVDGARPQVGEPGRRTPGGAAVRRPRIPRVEVPGPVVLPDQAEVAGRRAVLDLRERAVAGGVDEDP